MIGAMSKAEISLPLQPDRSRKVACIEKGKAGNREGAYRTAVLAIKNKR